MSDLLTVFLPLIGMGALFAWTACLLFGCRLLAPDRAIVVGVGGLWIGWDVFRKLGLPLGPTVSGVEVVPGFVGTMLVLIVYLLLRSAYASRTESTAPPPPRALDRSRTSNLPG